MKQMIVELPATTNFDILPDDVKSGLMDLNIGNILLLNNTTMVDGNVLVLALTGSGKDVMQAKFDELNLDWTIRAFEGEKIVKGRIVAMLAPKSVHDDKGVEIGTITPSDIKGILHTFAGHKWSY